MNYKQLEQKIITSYNEGVTPMTGETLAAEFLAAQISVSEELKKASIASKMLRSNLKDTCAKIFYNEATKGEKKPSDSLLQAIVDSHHDVKEATFMYIEAEEEANELERLYNIFREAHIFYRGVAKGKFD